MYDVVSREVLVPADVAATWAALTDAEQVAEWFGDTAEIDLRVGGPVRFTWPAGEVSRGVVTTVVPSVAFGYRWDVFGTVVEPSVFTQVEFQLRAVEGGTSVRVVETGLDRLVAAGVAPDREALFEEHVDGWRNETGDLVRYLESGGRPLDAAAAAAVVDVDVPQPAADPQSV